MTSLIRGLLSAGLLCSISSLAAAGGICEAREAATGTAVSVSGEIIDMDKDLGVVTLHDGCGSIDVYARSNGIPDSCGMGSVAEASGEVDASGARDYIAIEATDLRC